MLHTIAGAISWLSRTYDFAGKVNDTDLGVDVVTVEGVNELAFDINDKGGMNYTANDGVLNTILLTGKNAYVAAKKLPIESRLVTTNIFAEMQQAMKAGKTVELSLRFQPAGAHMVGVAGYSTKEKGGSTVMRTPGHARRVIDEFRNGYRQRRRAFVQPDALHVSNRRFECIPGALRKGDRYDERTNQGRK